MSPCVSPCFPVSVTKRNMKSCCICFSPKTKVTPSVLPNPRSTSIKYQRNDLSVTILAADPVVLQSVNGLLLQTVGATSPSPALNRSRPKPKVYSVHSGTHSMCRTPSAEPPHSAQLKRSKVYKHQSKVPRSALLPPDLEAKKVLMKLQLLRSHTQEQPA